MTKVKSFLIVVLLSLFGALPALALDSCFPGERRTIFSPSRNYQLTWKNGSRDSQGVEARHLLFNRKGETDSRDFFEFYNEACIHWSPDEKYFTVSHLVGSNIAEDIIFESRDVSRRVDVMDLVPENVRSYFRKRVVHGYVETTAWNRDGLFIRAWGDREDEPRTFDIALKCHLYQGKWTCKTVNK